jgi:hypothetical protein
LNESREKGKWGGLAAPLGGVLVLAVLAVPAWLAYQGTGANPGPVVPLPAAVSLQARWPMGAPVQESVAAPATPTVPATPAVPAPRASEVSFDNCVNTPGQESPRSPGSAAEARRTDTLPARERLAAALATGPDEMSRAVGRVLQGLVPGRAASEAPVCEGPRCPPVAERGELPGAVKQSNPAGAAQRDALAHLALYSRSPEVYAIALQTCRHEGGDDPGSACRMLSADQWARLEPDNAVPWFEVAAQAQQRGDQAALAEAMFRVSKSREVDTRAGQLADAVLKRLPPGTSPQVALGVAGELSRLDTVWNSRRYQVPLAYCSANRLADSNYHQLCSEIAELLLSRGRAVQELGVAAQLGERLGWGAERIEAITLQRDAMLQAMVQDGADGATGCAALRRKSERLGELTQQGERAAARLAMQRIGKTEADLARQYRERRTSRMIVGTAGASAPRP